MWVQQERQRRLRAFVLLPISFFPFMRGVVLILSLVLPVLAPAENWPQWRGPRLDGTSLDGGFPVKADAQDRLAGLTTPQGPFDTPLALGALGLLGLLVADKPIGRRKALALPAFFCFVNAAALRASWNVLSGRRIDRWEPRRDRHTSPAGVDRLDAAESLHGERR